MIHTTLGMVTMTYEDMTLAQLKSLAKDRNLGTGRSKQDIIDKLVANDEHLEKVANMTEEELETLWEEGTPVDIEPAPQPAPTSTPEPELQDEDPRPTIFRITISHNGPLLDSQHEAYRKRTYGLAEAEGLVPFGGETAPRLVKAEDGQLTYEVEVH